MENKNKEGMWQATKFLLFSISAGVIQVVVFSLLELCQLNYWICYLTALILSVIWNFTLNRKFTFKAANNVPLAMGLAFLFYVPFYPFQTWYVGTVTGAIRDAIGQPDATWPSIIAEGTVMLINGILEFCWQKFIVFRMPKGKDVIPDEENDIDSEEDKAE